MSRAAFFKLLRLGLAISVAAVAGNQVWKSYKNVTSRQAFVNAEIVHVRNPIAGSLQLKNVKPGEWLTAGVAIGKVENVLQASELDVKQQELQSRIQINQQQRLSINAQIADRRAALNQFNQEFQAQKQLEAQLARQQVEEVKSQLAQSQIASQAAQKEANRYLALVQQGVLAQMIADQALSRSNQTQAEVISAQARFGQAIKRLQAAQVGLQLEGSRTLSYPEIRKRELQTEISDLQRQAVTLQTQGQGLKTQLFKLNQQFKLNKSIIVAAPTTGAIWSIDAKAGEYITSNTPILKVLNCQTRWIDAFFSESDTKNLAAGTPVKIRLLGADNQDLEGKIEAIRGGSGRVTTGRDVAVPPPDSARRQVAVRVQVKWRQNPNSVQFCDVGRSAEVVIAK